MLYIVKGSDETTETDPVITSILAHVEAGVKLAQDHHDHPNADLAVHILDLYSAAARAAARSDETALDMSHWQYDLSHHCDMHTYAAIFLLAATAPNTRDGAVLLAHQGLDAVQQLFVQQ